MSTRNNTPALSRRDIAVDLAPFLRVYNDGRTKIFVRHTTVPPPSSRTRKTEVGSSRRTSSRRASSS
uniref:Uncharacterized protein n=1 Tax=Leersia perrieri TaxID=77586 RepID=A0A0D9VXP3_9ORYZ